MFAKIQLFQDNYFPHTLPDVQFFYWNLENKIKIDPFKFNAANLPGVQNYWGEGKMYSKCIEKVGRFSSIIWGRLAFDNFHELQSKDT